MRRSNSQRSGWGNITTCQVSVASLTDKRLPKSNIEFSIWIYNDIHIKPWNVITRPCSNFNDGSAKPSLNLKLDTGIYCQTSNMICSLVGNKIVDRSDVVRASPVGAAATTSSFSTEHLASMDWAKTTARRDEKHLRFSVTYIRDLTAVTSHIRKWMWLLTHGLIFVLFC